METPEISIVVPIYGCADSINELVERIDKSLNSENISYELVLVDDRSKDNAWNLIKEQCKSNAHCRGVRLSKNFGQHYAISAGVDLIQGSWCVVMDGDLQDQPEEIPKLYKKALEGYDVVFAVRAERKDAFLKKFTSKLFYKFFNYLSDIEFDHKLANFSICSKKVYSNIRKFKEKSRAYPYFTLLCGFEHAKIEVEHAERKYGESSYNFFSRLNMALSHILSHSSRPLILMVQLGLLISLLAFLFGSWSIVKYFVWGQILSGWTSLIVSLYFLSGLIMALIGIVGVYVGKIFEEVKRRPLYIVDEEI